MYILRQRETKKFLLSTLEESSERAWQAWEKSFWFPSDTLSFRAQKALLECCEVDIEVRNVVGG